MKKIRHKIFNALVCFVMGLTSIVTLAPFSAVDVSALTEEGFESGTGVETDPWIIETPEQLDLLHNYVGERYRDTYFELGNDLNLYPYLEHTQEGWNPIGTAFDNFYGHFNGANHRIKGLWIDRPSQSQVGLFGVINGSTIQNLWIEGMMSLSIIGNQNVGSLVGIANSATFTNVYSVSSVIGNSNVGGLIGQGSQLTLNMISFNGNVIGTNNSGGLVGVLRSDSSLMYSYSQGAVDGTPWFAGGLVGYSDTDVVIESSYSVSDVTGIMNLGGLVGIAISTSIDTSYFAGTIDGNTSVGGIIGFDGGETSIGSVYYDSNLSGATTAIGGTANQLGATSTGQLASENSPILAFNSFTYPDYSNNVGAIESPIIYPQLRTFAESTDERVRFYSKRSVMQQSSIEHIISENQDYLYDGNGSESQPYLIYTPEQFNHTREHTTSFFELRDSIDMTDLLLDIPYGWMSYDLVNGGFNGNNHTISGMWANSEGLTNTGLFRRLDNSTIHNVVLILNNDKGGFQANHDIGGMVGLLENSSEMSDCIVIGNITNRVESSGISFTGGLAYQAINSTIENSIYSGIISANGDSGGLVGILDNASINSSFAMGSVSGSVTGGLVGSMTTVQSSIRNSYANMSVTGSSNAGGLVGNLSAGGVTGSVALGLVSGDGLRGGVVGTPLIYLLLDNIYFDTDGTGKLLPTPNQPLTGATGLTTKEMVSSDSLTNDDKMSSLDSLIWSKREKNTTHTFYPELRVFSEAGSDLQKQLSQESAQVQRRELSLQFETSPIEFGNILGDSVISGNAFDNTGQMQGVEGNVQWVDESIIPEVGSRNYHARFTSSEEYYLDYDPFDLQVTVNPAQGAQASIPTLVSKDGNSIEVTSEIITNPGNQVIEYNYVVDGLLLYELWQESGVFGGLDEYTEYHFVARAKENNTHSNGNISDTTAIMTRDVSAPTARISYQNSALRNFLNLITFNLFFKETLNITIQGYDESSASGNSGVKDVAYWVSDQIIEHPETEITQWTRSESDRLSFSIDANTARHIYAQVTDNEGNISIYQDGVVVYSDVRSNVSQIDYYRLGNELVIPVNLEGNTISKIKVNDVELTETQDYSTINESIIIRKSYMETLDAKDYLVTIETNPLGYTYVENDINEAPTPINFILSVKRNPQYLEFTDFETTFTYGDTPFEVGLNGLGSGATSLELVNNDGVASLDGTMITLHKPGTFSIRGHIDADQDYDGTTIERAITVNKAAITVRADNQVKRYGEGNPNLSVTVEPGLIGNDILNGTLMYEGHEVGTYDLVQETRFEHPYYEITFEKGTMTILPTLKVETWNRTMTDFKDTLTSRDDADTVAILTNDYQSLSDVEKTQVMQSNLTKLETMQGQAGSFNATQDTVTLKNIPWYVRVVVEVVTSDDVRYQDFNSKITNEALLALYDIKLINTLTGGVYTLSDGQRVSINIQAAGLPTDRRISIYHERDGASIEHISANYDQGQLSFEASSFSLFGITAERIQAETETQPSESTSSISNLGVVNSMYTWLIPCGLALFLYNLLSDNKKSKR